MFHSTKEETGVQLNLADLVHEQDFLKSCICSPVKFYFSFLCDFWLVLEAQIYCLACKFISQIYASCEKTICFDIEIEVQLTR